MSVPVFAVVGRTNKGKSSIIATLAEDDRVVISPVSGTTKETTEFPVEVDGRRLFVLADTPGFEEAQRALAWLEAVPTPVSGRQARVRALVDAFSDGDELVEERRLLQPILAGACILYVADGAQPYRDNYRAEMEILRWTGQPRMALVNRVGQGDHGDEWRRALGQYFSVVRDFDAHASTFDERIRLLTTFRELHEPWREPLEEAIHALKGERERRREEVADLITQLLIDELTFTLETRVEGADQEAREKQKIEEAFHAELRARETRARRAVEAVYQHRAHWAGEGELERPSLDEDLFAKRTWDVLGLTAPQIIAAYTVSGAAIGGLVDASVGGASFLAGTVIGSVAGAGFGALHLQRRLARATSAGGALQGLRRAFSSGTALRIGPHAHPSFPFVVLDRAVLHAESVAKRAHARQDRPVVEPGQGPSQALPEDRRKALQKLFAKIRDDFQDVPLALRAELRAEVSRIVVERVR